MTLCCLGRRGEISSPEFTFSVDSYSVSTPQKFSHRSSIQKTHAILPKVQVTGYTQICIPFWPDEVRVRRLCCQGIMWEPIRETNSHTTRSGTLGHSRLSSLSHCGLILAERVELVPSPSCGQHAFKSLRTFKSSRSPFDKRRLIWLVVWKQFVLYNGNCDFFKIEEKDLTLLSLIRPSGDHRRPTAHSWGEIDVQFSSVP